MKETGYLIQATLIISWWLGMFLSVDFYEAFQYPDIGESAFNALVLPYIIVIALLSILRAYRPYKELEFIILGGFSFATLYCIGASILTEGGLLPITIMILGMCYNFFLMFNEKVFRTNTSTSYVILVLKTLIQIICIWIITLIVFPALIIDSFAVEVKTGLWIKGISIVLFIAFSILGLCSARMFIFKGAGTPLPMDQTQNLVVSGPYKYVRNPMALGGVGQVLSIGMFIGSIHIVVYGLLGAVLWHFVVKPSEERDLHSRFGKQYIDYSRKVRCWFPRIKYENKPNSTM